MYCFIFFCFSQLTLSFFSQDHFLYSGFDICFARAWLSVFCLWLFVVSSSCCFCCRVHVIVLLSWSRLRTCSYRASWQNVHCSSLTFVGDVTYFVVVGRWGGLSQRLKASLQLRRQSVSPDCDSELWNSSVHQGITTALPCLLLTKSPSSRRGCRLCLQGTR